MLKNDCFIIDIPDLTNCISDPISTLTCGTDGKENTRAIIAY